MQAVYGAFTTEQHVSRTGEAKPNPWTEEDQRRLDGHFTVRDRRGDPRLMPPHVMTSAGPYWIGKCPGPAPGSRCPRCGALKCHRPRVVRLDGFDRFCFGCGRGSMALRAQERKEP